MSSVDPLYRSLKYSLRRYFVDEFLTRQVADLPADSLVLDAGGNRIRKRGQFDIGCYPLRVIYVNLSLAKRPHIQADAAFLPFTNACFDAVVCTEVFEHVPSPQAVLHETFRVLKDGGVLLITVPFLFRIHADPHDFGRYTDYYWSRALTIAGFDDYEMKKQGLFWSVFVDMLREWIKEATVESLLNARLLRGLVARCLGWGRRKALAWDTQPEHHSHPFFSSFTTGFEIRATKRSLENE